MLGWLTPLFADQLDLPVSSLQRAVAIHNQKTIVARVRLLVNSPDHSLDLLLTARAQDLPFGLLNSAHVEPPPEGRPTRVSEQNALVKGCHVNAFLRERLQVGHDLLRVHLDVLRGVHLYGSDF